MRTTQRVQKLWNYCNILRDDLSACAHAQAGGLSPACARSVCLAAQADAHASRDYVEQLTFLLFLSRWRMHRAGRRSIKHHPLRRMSIGRV
jgi:hypothetical protein